MKNGTVPDMANGETKKKPGRKFNPLALSNVGSGKSIWQPFTQEYVTKSQYMQLKKKDIHLNELKRNNWIDHPDFNGKMEDDHWIDTTNVRINTALDLDSNEVPDIAKANSTISQWRSEKSILQNEVLSKQENLNELCDIIEFMKHGMKCVSSDLAEFRSNLKSCEEYLDNVFISRSWKKLADDAFNFVVDRDEDRQIADPNYQKKYKCAGVIDTTIDPDVVWDPVKEEYVSKKDLPF